MTIFDILHTVEPGEWIDESRVGRKLSFDELSAGQIIVVDKSTVSTKWYQMMRLERIIPYNGKRRAICYDGERQRSLINEGQDVFYELEVPDE